MARRRSRTLLVNNNHDQTTLRTDTSAAFRRRRRRSTRPDDGHDRQQGHPEIPASDLRAVVAEEGPEETSDGTGSHTEASRQSGYAYRLHQQSSGSHRQQDVRMRDDPMSVAGRGLNAEAHRKGATMIRGQSLGALLLAWGVLLAVPGKAQPQQAPRTSKPAKPSSKAAARPVEPVLEPKAIDLLKASSSRLAAAHSLTFTTVISYESPSRLGPPLIYTTRSEVTLQRPDKLRVIT